MHQRGLKCYFVGFVSVLSLFGIIGTYRSALQCTFSPRSVEDLLPRRVRDSRSLDSPQTDEYQNVTSDHDDLLFHPFDNTCKFVLPNTYASDITHFRVGERLRQLKCPYDDYDLATMDSEGFMYVHPHFSRYPNITADVKCKVVFVEGGIRAAGHAYNKFEEVAVVDAPENKRFLANGDAFFIRCHQKEKMIFEKAYAGIRDLSKDKNKIYLIDDTESFDRFGVHQRTTLKPKQPSRYSIDILTFDSTSRTMFMRHMPRSVELMRKLGYEILYGYTKVGDNSMVNLEPILAGDIEEALSEPKYDNSSDINLDWILPTYKKLDPTLLPFLWKMMKEKFGCRTMFNDDIAVASRGIFHYPASEFQAGFTSQPTDHYYRPYYLAVYKKWVYTPCKDGGQVQREFVDIWRRFANKYRDICHFGFTFITSLTHEASLLIEPMDEFLRSSLENLQQNGALDNSVSVIMGDHGNRIGLVQFSYTGRIEERMPLMAIRLPTNFKTLYPKEYANFLTNKYKLTSNFDIHQTLKDIALMRLGAERNSQKRDEGRGISLFDEIPSNRSCHDAYVAENFCTCLIDRSNLTMPKEKDPLKKKELAVTKYKEAIISWIKEKGLESCLDNNELSMGNDVQILGLNALVRHGMRTKRNVTAVEMALNKPPKMDFLYHEFETTHKLSNGQKIRLLFRIEEEVATSEFRVVFEPSVRDPPVDCTGHSISRICDCLFSN